MIPNKSQRLSQLRLNYFAEQAGKIERLKAIGAEVIHLDIGSPDLPPPDAAVAELNRSASNPAHHGYQSHRWTPEYRQAWADYYHRYQDVKLDPELEVLPLIGSKEGIFHLMQALVNPGDVVLMPDPGYITYSKGTSLAGAEPVPYALDESNGYLPVLDHISPEILQRAKILWLNYPHNPTGGTASPEVFAQAVDFARRNHLLVCHDAAYTQITFDDYLAPSILTIPGAREVALEFNTLSKTYAMAGWRVAAAVGNPVAIQGLLALKSHADSGHFLPIIQAATVALHTDADWVTERNRIYQKRRDLLYSGLQALQLQPFHPRAGLYIWAKVPTGTTSTEFVSEVLEHTHISLTPGIVFGSRGEGFVRFTITNSSTQIEAALARLEEWMQHGNSLSDRR